MPTLSLNQAPDLFAHALLGVTPHPKQAEWLRCRARTKVACCGRRWGKSYAEATDLIWFAFAHDHTEQFLIAPTHDQSTVIFRYVEAMLRDAPHPLVASMVEKVVYSPFPEIRFRNGAIIRARSAGNDATNLRGHKADRIVLDEAAFIPEAVYATISPLLANSQYQELVMISTPWGKNTFFDYWQRGQSPDHPAVQSFRFPSGSSPYVSDAYLAQQQRELTATAYATEYLAEFHEDAATVFKHELIESCIEDRAPGPIAGHRYVIGYDPAKWVDRSAVVVLDITTRPWHVVEVRDIAGRDYSLQAPIIRDLAAQYHRARVLLDVGLANDQMLESLLRDGVDAEGFQFTNPSKQDLISGLVIAMEQGHVRFYRHADLLKELSYYRFELTAAGNVKLGAPDKPGHHDDLVTALALAVRMANTAGGMPYQYVATSPQLTAPVTRDEEPLSDEERIRRRVAAYHAAHGG